MLLEIVLIGLLVGVIGLVLYLQWMFRRHAVNVLDSTMLPSNIQQSKLLTNDERAFIQASFRNSPDFQWITGYNNSNSRNSTSTTTTNDVTANEDLEQIHTNVTKYMMELILSFTERYGYVLIQRASDDKSKITGCALLIPPYVSFGRRSIQWMRVMIPLGIPPVPMKYTKLISARFNAFVETTECIQQQQMKTCSHWYIVNLSLANNKSSLMSSDGTITSTSSPTVDSGDQSLALVKAVQEIVIKHGNSLLFHKLPSNKIYTECNDTMAQIFQKAGFQLLQRYALNNSGIPNEEQPYYYNGLCWTAKNDPVASSASDTKKIN